MAHTVILGAGIGDVPCAIGMSDMLPGDILEALGIVRAIRHGQPAATTPQDPTNVRHP